MPEIPTANSNHINLITWNILLDETRTDNGIVEAQDKRIESQAKTLMELGVDLNVVVLQEAEKRNGHKIAELTGHEPGFWEQHKRQRERIGMFGGMVEGAEFYPIGDDKKVVITHIGGLAILGLHLSPRPKRWRMRMREMQQVCELIDGEEEVAVVGDFNGPWWEPARLMLASRGLRSAFTQLGEKHPPTYPTENYRDIMWTPRQQRILPHQVAVDGIQLRGVRAVDAGTFEGDSDHYGVHATLAA